ncbi:MAG: hypothetical protein WBD49_12435, partial [Bradyrhizobium sp.]
SSSVGGPTRIAAGRLNHSPFAVWFESYCQQLSEINAIVADDAIIGESQWLFGMTAAAVLIAS